MDQDIKLKTPLTPAQARQLKALKDFGYTTTLETAKD